MGLLDNLRQQSQQLKTKEQQEQQQLAALEAKYRQLVQPGMVKLYRVLDELAKHLNYIKPDITVSYQMNADGKVLQYRQQDYQVRVDSLEDTKKVVMSFCCAGEVDVVFSVEGKRAVDKHQDYLHRHGLKFHCRKNIDEQYELRDAQFVIKPVVPIVMEFVGDVEKTRINFNVKNFGSLGVVKHAFNHDQINDEFLDELGRYILHENPDFLKLSISDDEIERIRARLAQEARERDLELKRAQQTDLPDNES